MYLLNLAAYCVLKYSLSLKKKLEEEEFDLHMSTYTLIFFKYQILQYYGQGSLACCDSWGCKKLDGTERLKWLTDWLTYNSDLVESLNVKFKDQHRYRGPTLKLYSYFLLCKGSVPLTEMLFKDHQYYISFSAEVLTSWATDLCCGVLGFGPHSRKWAGG